MQVSSYIVLDRVVVQSYDGSSGLLDKGLIPSAIRIDLSYIH